MKSKQSRIKIGDRIKCNCGCDEVKGTVIKVYKNEIVHWQKDLYTGFLVKNDKDTCGGGEVICAVQHAVKI